ncbi:MAG: NAD(P)-dependent oxidoreductase [Chloroflexota bacterium]
MTGAAGMIGRYLTAALRERYDLRLTDVRAPDETFGLPFAQADIADLEAMRPICRGVDTVVHLAADPRTFAPWETLLPANVIGAYNTFQAAAEAGCRRVVFASTINAVAGYPEDTQIHTWMPVRPANLYGATKAWGEALARLYADQHGLSAICLRFGAVVSRDDTDWITPDSRFLDIILTIEDAARLVAASIDAPDDLRFGIFHGLSNNRYKRMDISDARAVLGYDPQDDAFALAEARGRAAASGGQQ